MICRQRLGTTRLMPFGTTCNTDVSRVTGAMPAAQPVERAYDHGAKLFVPMTTDQLCQLEIASTNLASKL